MAIKTGVSAADLLYGTATADTIFGGGGDDIAFGGGGDDVAFGGNNNDTLYGGNGVDTLNGDAGDDIAYGGIDNDRLFGGDGNDLIVGDDGADTLDGGNGNDILRGEEGNDRLFGGNQDDTLYGGGGADYADAGAGNDHMFLGAGADTAVGGTGDDVIDGEDGADTISGDGGTDTIYGSDGNDSLAGGDAADSLFGGIGNDSLAGGDGADELHGGLGNDFLYGGAGNDSAVFGGSLANATITGTYGGTMTVISDEGRDILVSIENISFTGGANGPPVITSYYGADDHELSVAENTGGVIADVDATDPDSDPITYAISGGVDATLFTVDSNGKLSFLDPPDFEGSGDNSYEVVVRASDDHGHFDEQTFTVDVTDANEAPLIAGGDNDTLSFAENDTDPVTTVSATDPDAGDQVTYSLDGGDDTGFFTIDPTTGVLSFIDPPDFEDPQDDGGDNSYVVVVKAEDGDGLFDEQTITVDVTDANEAAVIAGGDNDTISFAEDDTDAVTTVSATDPDVGDQVTYSLDGGDDAGFFTIDASTGVLSFIDPPDFEDPQDDGGDNSYVVIVKAEDGSGLFDEQTITVDVTDVADVDSPPVIGGGDNDTVSFAENDTGPVTTVSATDPDAGDQVTYSFDGGDDVGFFTIDPATGVLSFIDPPDFEDPQDDGGNNSYVVIVKAEDGSGQFDEQTITVNVTDANDAPVIISDGGDNDAIVSFAENGSDPVTTVAATDADADDITYSIVGGADATFFGIDSDTGELLFVYGGNFEDPQDDGADNSYEVIVRADDGNGGIDDQTITVNVTDVNEKPTIPGGEEIGLSFAENDTDPVTTVAASDPDAGDSVTYSLDGGDDASFFTIDPSTGVLSFIDPPNFEDPQDDGADNTYVVVVSAQDSSGLFYDQNITVTVTDANEVPVIGGGDNDTISFAENDTDPVTTVAASDPDAGDSVTYSLDGGDDAGFFTIDASTGVLSFIDPPNFEDPQDNGGDNSYVVIVKAEDSSGLFDEQTITVDVTDANEAPLIAGGDNDTVSFAENDTDAVTTVAASDPDAGDSVTYSLDGGDDAGFFTIDSSTGALSFIDPPNFEDPQDNGTNNSYVVVVKAEDSDGLFDEQTITVNVTDVIEGPGADPNDHDDVDGGATVSGSSTNAADIIYGTAADNSLSGGNNDDLIYGGLGDDTIDGSNDNDRLFGGEGNDLLSGSNDSDTIYGDSGNDSIDGANGNDFLYGGSGDDSILGGHDDDVFIGGYGHDTLNGAIGGDGSDTFAYLSLSDAGDTIIGFNAATDVIEFSSAAFAAPGWTAGNALPAGDFGTYFTYAGGVLSYDADGAGGGSAIVIATLTGAPALTAAELFLF